MISASIFNGDNKEAALSCVTLFFTLHWECSRIHFIFGSFHEFCFILVHYLCCQLFNFFLLCHYCIFIAPLDCLIFLFCCLIVLYSKLFAWLISFLVPCTVWLFDVAMLDWSGFVINSGWPFLCMAETVHECCLFDLKIAHFYWRS